MKSFIAELAGGLAIIVVAAAIGLAHNAVREKPIKLVQKVKPVSTVSHGGADKSGGGGSGSPSGTTAPGEGSGAGETGADIPLPEGAVGVADVKAMFDAGTAVIIDARAPSAFEEGHIPGAMNVPYDRLPDYIDQLLAEVPMDAEIVCYCWGPDCDFSDQLATEMKILGYENIMVFTGGWEHWEREGHPVDGTKAGE